MTEIHLFEDLPRGPRNEINENAGFRFDTVLRATLNSFEAIATSESQLGYQDGQPMEMIQPSYDTAAGYAADPSQAYQQPSVEQAARPVDQDENFLVAEIGDHAKWNGKPAPAAASADPVLQTAPAKHFGSDLFSRTVPFLEQPVEAPQPAGFTEIGPATNVFDQTENQVYMNGLQADDAAPQPMVPVRPDNGLDIDAIRDQVTAARDNFVPQNNWGSN